MVALPHEVTSRVFLEDLDENVYEPFSRALEESIRHSKRHQGSYDIFLRLGFLSRESAESLILLSILSAFISGVAAGAGRKRVKAEDVEKAISSMCARWPDCSTMRLKGIMKSLPSLDTWRRSLEQG